MSVEENKALVRRVFEEVLTKHDLDGAAAIMVADFAHHVYGFSDLHGLEKWKQLVHSIFDAFPDGRWAVEEMLAQGDRVAVRWTFRCTHTGAEWAGIPPTGREVATSYMSFFDVANGKIAKERTIGDSLDLWQQLGIIPPLEEMIEQYKSKQA